MTGGWTAPGSAVPVPESAGQTESAGQAAPGGARPAGGGPGTGTARELVERVPLFPLRPLGLGEILVAATRIYRARPRTVLVLSGIVFAIGFLLSTVLTGVSMIPTITSLQAAVESPQGPQATGGLGDGEVVATFASSAASGAITLIATQLVTVALALVTVGEATGRRIGDGAVWRSLPRQGARAVLAEVIVAAVTAVLALLLLGLGLVPVLLAQEARWWTIAPIAAGALAALVATLYVRGRAALVTPAIAIEDIGPLRGIARSLALTRGRRLWRVLGISLLIGLIAALVIQLVASVLGGVGMVAYVVILVATQFTQLALAVGVLLVSTMFASYLATVLVQPFLSAGTAVLYADQRMRHEAWDIELDRAARADRGTAPAPGR